MIYAINETRFDIAFAISIVYQFINNSVHKYVTSVKYIFCNLRKYPSLRISYKKSNFFFLHGYIDWDWAINPITHCLTTRYLFTIIGGIISDSSKRQQSITLSSTEAEYIVYCQATKEIVWLQLLLKNSVILSRALLFSHIIITVLFCLLIILNFMPKYSILISNFIRFER